MTLAEAIKSGRTFKRPVWHVCYQLQPDGVFKSTVYSEVIMVSTLDLYPEDLLADDYIILDELIFS